MRILCVREMKTEYKTTDPISIENMLKVWLGVLKLTQND